MFFEVHIADVAVIALGCPKQMASEILSCPILNINCKLEYFGNA